MYFVIAALEEKIKQKIRYYLADLQVSEMSPFS